jgi:hypothetical protein
MEDKTLEILKQIEGLQTIDTVAQALNIKKQSALNLLSKLKKQKYVTVSGGGKQKRFYRITTTKQLPRDPGMFDIINKHSPMKINPWYDHQVHGPYTVEDALLDALQTESFRLILASMHLFRHVTDWPKLYRSKDWQKVGALYDVARLFMRVNRMPERYRKQHFTHRIFFIRDYITKEHRFLPIDKKWGIPIPFRLGDIQKTLTG